MAAARSVQSKAKNANAADWASAASGRLWRSAFGLREFELPGLLTAAAAIVLEHEGNLVALIETADASPLQSGRVHEHVVAAAVRLDEAEALGRVEEFHGPSDSHGEIVLSR